MSELEDELRRAPRRPLAASLPGPIELEEVIERAKERQPQGLLLDLPPGQAATRIMTALRRGGWRVAADGALVSELGEAIAQRKVWLLATRRGEPPAADWLTHSGQPRTFPPPMATYLDPPHRVAAGRWLPDEAAAYRTEPRAAHLRADGLPRLASHWRPRDGSARKLVYGINGPVPTLLLDGEALREVLIADPKGPGTGVRPLTPLEAWRLHGGADRDWDEHVAVRGESSGLRWALKALPEGAAQAAVAAALAQPVLLGRASAGARRTMLAARKWTSGSAADSSGSPMPGGRTRRRRAPGTAEPWATGRSRGPLQGHRRPRRPRRRASRRRRGPRTGRRAPRR